MPHADIPCGFGWSWEDAPQRNILYLSKSALYPVSAPSSSKFHEATRALNQVVSGDDTEVAAVLLGVKISRVAPIALADVRSVSVHDNLGTVSLGIEHGAGASTKHLKLSAPAPVGREIFERLRETVWPTSPLREAPVSRWTSLRPAIGVTLAWCVLTMLFVVSSTMDPDDTRTLLQEWIVKLASSLGTVVTSAIGGVGLLACVLLLRTRWRNPPVARIIQVSGEP